MNRTIYNYIRSLLVANISQAVLDAIAKAKVSQEVAVNADTEHSGAVEDVVEAQQREFDTGQTSLEAHRVALDDAHAAIQVLKDELGLKD
jgi:uncharacterized cupredoxin-like copper-binding protein